MEPSNRLEHRWSTTRIGYGDRPVVLCVDMQRVDTENDSPPPFGRHMPGFDLMRRSLATQNRLIDAARAANIQVIYTRQLVRKDGKDSGWWKLPLTLVYTAESQWSEICPELAPIEGDIVVHKTMASAFFGTPLLSILIPNMVDTLIVTGSSTSGCIRATVIDSFSYGYRTILPEDCIGDIAGEDAHWASLSDIDCRYADVVHSDEVLKYFDQLRYIER
jgi:maleamate amidohydrolase